MFTARWKRVFVVLIVVLTLSGLAWASTQPLAKFSTKFRDIPPEVIRVLAKQFSVVLTPYGPSGETPLGAEDLVLTPWEEEQVAQMTLGEYYFMGASLDFTEILNEYGMNKVLAQYGFPRIRFMGASTISEQIDQVVILTGKARVVSFVIAQAWEAVTLGPVFVDMARAGVPQAHNWTTPVGLYGVDNYIGLIDADGYAQGAGAAEILAYSMGYEGQVGIIYFALEQWTNVMRLRGAEETFAKYPSIEIVARAGFTDDAQSFDLAVGMLQANPGIDAIWATWMMGPATGAAEAVMALNKVGEVIVAAPDLGGDVGAKYIADPNNPIIGAAEADCVEMGENSIRAALKFLAGNIDIQQGYFVSSVYVAVRANLVEVYNKTNLDVLGPLPQEVIDLLEAN